MPDPIPSCFRGGAVAAGPPAASAEPSVTTSIYETHLGLAALTWSRTVLGLSLRVDLRLPSSAASASAASPSPSRGANSASDAASVSSSGAVSAECADASFRFRLRPWLFWKRRGSRRFQLKDQPQGSHHYRAVDFAWDLTRSRFPQGGGPEPCAGFFVAVAVDGEMFLVVGDMETEAYKKTKARNPFPAATPSKMGTPGNPILISRREHVVLSGAGRPYTTRARLGGKDREISIDLGGGGGAGEREAKMAVALDGKRVIQVKRLRWKFRGNEKVEVDGGARVQVSWDVHNWLFDREPDPSAPVAASAPAAPAAELGHAVFVFRVDRDDAGDKNSRRQHRSSAIHGGGGWRGLYGLGNFPGSDRSSSSIGGAVAAAAAPKGVGGKKKRSLLKTSSSSSSSSASSGSSLSVAEWASAEESELQGSGGFSLLVYMWKS